jgi:segregation and condensation protein B
MENNIDSPMEHIKGVVEALLFVNEKPIMIDQIRKVLDTVTPTEIKKAISIIQKEHEGRQSGVNVVEIAGGYQMLSNPIFANYIREFYKTKHKEKLSKPALETLAIMAYKQPVTRADVEVIRGVNSDGVVTHLVEKELIKIVGRKDVAGRPFLYGTTKQFMEYFGLKSLDDLPNLEEFPSLQPEEDSNEAVLDELTGLEMNPMEKAKQAAIREAGGEGGDAFVPQEFLSDEEAFAQEDAKEGSVEGVDNQENISSTVLKAEEFINETDQEGQDNEPK